MSRSRPSPPPVQQTQPQREEVKPPTPARRASFISSATAGINLSNFRVGGVQPIPNPVAGRSRRTGPTLLGG